jgi:SAM-dependent methyltransferase
MASIYHEHADIYDLAFDWDVSAEAEWLHSRLGAGCTSVLEPGCGSGRIVEALARRGLEAVGIDRSPQMVELARKRLAELDDAEVVLGDITDFSLGRTFDGAVCPINTLLHVSPGGLAGHLEAMAAHLRPGARYLVQLALFDPEDPGATSEASRWKIAHGETVLDIVWATEHVDAANGRLRQRSRIELLSGPRAGEVLEETHEMTAWTPERWRDAIERSPFEAGAIYDGGRDDWPRVPQGAVGLLLWHELTRV